MSMSMMNMADIPPSTMGRRPNLVMRSQERQVPTNDALLLAKPNAKLMDDGSPASSRKTTA